MAIKQIKLPNGQVLEIDEWLDWDTYSTIEFAAGVKVQLDAFNYVAGQRVARQGLAARSATLADTNQVVAGKANYDEAFLIYALTYECFALTTDEVSTGVDAAPAPMLSATNLRRLQRDLMVEFYIGPRQQKPQSRATFSFIGQGPGAPAFTSGDQLAAGIRFQYGTGGWPTPENQRRFELPIYVQPTTPYFLKVYSPLAIADLTQAVSMRWHTPGLKRRPVA